MLLLCFCISSWLSLSQHFWSTCCHSVKCGDNRDIVLFATTACWSSDAEDRNCRRNGPRAPRQLWMSFSCKESASVSTMFQTRTSVHSAEMESSTTAKTVTAAWRRTQRSVILVMHELLRILLLLWHWTTSLFHFSFVQFYSFKKH